MNLEQALKATKSGAIAALVSAAFTIVILFYALVSNTDGFLKPWNDPSGFFDVVFILICAFGIHRNSRAAAVTMCVYWIVAKIYLFFQTGQGAGVITGLVFLYLFAKAAQGTFAYHRIKKAEDPNYQSAPRWMYYVGIPSLVTILLLVVFGLATTTGYLPSTEVVVGREVSTEDRNELVSIGVLNEDEKIELFYSYGFLSILEGGNILSDRAVVTYFRGTDDKLNIQELTFSQIKNVELQQDGNFWNNAIYKIDSYDDGVGIAVELSIENGGDVRFIEALREKVQQARAD